MDTATQQHPLAALLKRRRWTAGTFLRLVADRHRALGFGGMAVRREKVSRWVSGANRPEGTTQYAMAEVLQISRQEVDARGWPDWL